MKLFEWECFDVDAYPTAVENCLKCVLTSFHNKERLRALVWEALHK